MVVRVMPNHLRKLQLLYKGFRHRHTDQTFAVGRHEIDIFCCRKLSGTDKIALVFAFRVIRHQNDLALSQIFQSFRNGIESHCCFSLFKSVAYQHFFRNRALPVFLRYRLKQLFDILAKDVGLQIYHIVFVPLTQICTADGVRDGGH